MWLRVHSCVIVQDQGKDSIPDHDGLSSDYGCTEAPGPEHAELRMLDFYDVGISFIIFMILVSLL